MGIFSRKWRTEKEIRTRFQPLLLIQLVFLVFALETLLSLTLLLSEKSMERNQWFLGYSAPRLGLATLLMLVLILLLIVTFKTLRNPVWTEKIFQTVRAWLLRDGHLVLVFAALIFALTLELAGLAVSFLSFPPAFETIRVVELRIWPLNMWATGLELQLLGMLVFISLQVRKQPLFFSQSFSAAVDLTIKKRFSIWAAFGFTAAAFFVLYALSPAHTGQTPGHDSGIFLYFGQRILAGDIPFRDIWDHKPPMIFYCDAFGLWLGGGSAWGVWTLELLSLLVSGWFAYRILKQNYSKRVSGIVLVVFALNLPLVLEGGNLTEEFALPFQLAGLYIFSLVLKEDRPESLSVIAGACMAIAFLFKQTLVGIWVAMALYTLILSIAERKPFPWKLLALGLSGATMVILLVAGYFGAKGALWDFWDVAFRYNLLYSAIPLRQRLYALADIFGFLITGSLFFTAALATWIILMFYAVRQKFCNLKPLLLIGLIDFPLEILLINASGKNYRHYFICLFPAMILLTASFLAWIPTMRTKLNIRATWSLPITVFLGVSMIPAGIQKTLMAYQQEPDRFILMVAEYIDQHTEAGDTLLMWGSQTSLNYLSVRPAPTRFVHQKPLFRTGYSHPSLVMEFLSDLEKNPPKLIVDTHLPSTPFIEMNAAGVCQFPNQQLPEGMNEVFEYVCTHYRLSDSLGKDHWDFYILKE